MSIIKDSGVFDSTFIPEKIPVRQYLVNDICSKLRMLNQYNLLLTGLTGNGKTITIKKVIKQMKKEITAVYIDCSENDSYGAVAKKILTEAKNHPYKEKGKNRYELADELRKLMLTKRSKKLVFIFDEIDKLVKKKDEHWNVLFPLLNHGKANFIFISNDGFILGKLDRKIFSRLQCEKLFLDAYSKEDITKILQQRAELGLKQDCYDINLLEKMGRFSADISGDIRFALKLFKQVVMITELNKQNKILEDTISQAIEELNLSDIEEIFPTLPRHMKIVVVALCLEAKKNGGIADAKNAYNIYVFNTKKEHFSAVGDRQYREYLSALAMLGLFEFQWKPAPNRRGRVRIAIPTFDFMSWLDKYFPD